MFEIVFTRILQEIDFLWRTKGIIYDTYLSSYTLSLVYYSNADQLLAAFPLKAFCFYSRVHPPLSLGAKLNGNCPAIVKLFMIYNALQAMHVYEYIF